MKKPIKHQHTRLRIFTEQTQRSWLVEKIDKKCNNTINNQLKRHANDLNYIRTANGKVQKVILQNAKPSLVKVSVLLTGNSLSGAVVLSPTQKDNLQKYATLFAEWWTAPSRLGGESFG